MFFLIVSYTGRQGYGKTMGMAVAARLLASHLGATIYSNMPMTGCVQIDKLSQLPLTRRPKVLCLDEAMFSLDSRMFKGSDSVAFTRFCAYLRKLHTCLLWSAQHPGMVDVRLRQQTNYAWIATKPSPSSFNYVLVDLASDRAVPIKFLKQKALFDFASYDTEEAADIVEADINWSKKVRISP